MALVHGTRHITIRRKYGSRRCLRGYAQAISGAGLTSNRLVGRRDPQQVLDEARARLLGVGVGGEGRGEGEGWGDVEGEVREGVQRPWVPVWAWVWVWAWAWVWVWAWAWV